LLGQLPILESRFDAPKAQETGESVRAKAASAEPGSIAVTSKPRSSNGLVAIPVPQPISSTRNPARKSGSALTMSKSSGG